MFVPSAPAASSARAKIRTADAVADSQGAYGASNFDDLADEFVTDHRPGLNAREVAADEMQVGAANAAQRNANERVSRVDDVRIGDDLRADAVFRGVYDRLHDRACVVFTS